jgi:hypothetical protein
MPKADTLDCPEFRQEVICAVARHYGFRPVKPKPHRTIKPLFRILATDEERDPSEHRPSLSPANETPREPTAEDFKMVCQLIEFARWKNRMRGNRNAKKKISQGESQT